MIVICSRSYRNTRHLHSGCNRNGGRTDIVPTSDSEDLETCPALTRSPVLISVLRALRGKAQYVHVRHAVRIGNDRAEEFSQKSRSSQNIWTLIYQRNTLTTMSYSVRASNLAFIVRTDAIVTTECNLNVLACKVWIWIIKIEQSTVKQPVTL